MTSEKRADAPPDPEGGDPDPGAADEKDNGKLQPPDTSAPLCDLCGGPMLELHCKLTCQRCGYQRDCSDP